MPRDDDDLDDDRPRRRRPRDDEEDDDRPSRSRRRNDDDKDLPARSRRRRDEDDDEDRPARSRRRPDDDEDDAPSPRKKKSNLPLVLGILAGVFLVCCGGGGFAVYYFGDKVVGEGRDRRESSNNLREIGLAFHNHHDRINAFPNNSYDPTGRPLLSWRVHLLPMLGEHVLFGQFRMDEPWDGPNNRQLISRMPRVYGTREMQARAGEGKTYYRGFSHQGAIFQRPQRPGAVPRINIANITDGTSNTILVVEAGEPVEWTRPDDIDWSPGRPLPPLGAGRAGDQVFVLMCDGSVRTFRKAMAETTWRALITYNGNEMANPD